MKFYSLTNLCFNVISVAKTSQIELKLYNSSEKLKSSKSRVSCKAEQLNFDRASFGLNLAKKSFAHAQETLKTNPMVVEIDPSTIDTYAISQVNRRNRNFNSKIDLYASQSSLFENKENSCKRSK